MGKLTRLVLLGVALGSATTGCPPGTVDPGLFADADGGTPDGESDALSADGDVADAETGDAAADGDVADAETGDAAADGGVADAETGDAASDGDVDAPADCVDGDGDGYGSGADCLAADCDDAAGAVHPGATETCNDTDDDCDGLVDDGVACPCTDGETRSCYTGPDGSLGMGVCAAGLETCTGGSFAGSCVGEFGPAGESCNGADDDCDGAVDEELGDLRCGLGACETVVSACSGGAVQTCTPGVASSEICDGVDNDCNGATDEAGACSCIYVSGGDASCCTGLGCAGGAANPFCSIAEAIGVAVAPGGPMRVCVAGHPGGGNENYDEAITMVEGLGLHGNYDPATWSRGNPSYVTRIRAQNALGVSFPAGTTRSTEIDGFTIQALEDSPSSSAAVTFDSSSGVVSNCVILAMNSDECYGISASGGGSPLITGDSLVSGGDSDRSAAIRCADTSLEVRGSGTDVPVVSGGMSGSGEAYGIWAVDCAGLYVDGAIISGGRVEDGRAAGFFFEGDNSGAIVTASTIRGGGTTGGGDAHGVWLESCAGTEPWIVANDRIWGGWNIDPASRVYGIFAQADCDVSIERNVEIKGGPESRLTRAIACMDGAHCSIQRNTLIEGSVWALSEAVGVYCGPGSCRDISGNTKIVGSRTPGDSIGVQLDGSGPTVDDNLIDGGCGGRSSTGVELNDSYARLTNNIITPGACASLGAAPSPVQYGIQQVNGLSHEPHVQSNTIDGGRTAATCTGRAVSIMAGTAGKAAGVYRNNILHAGQCSTRYGIQELSPVEADPRILENNVFWDATAAAYLDEAVNSLNTAAAINALSDVTASGNLLVDPGFTSGFSDVHLGPGSACMDQGTAAGAPATDFDGESRPAGGGFDIGADERL